MLAETSAPSLSHTMQEMEFIWLFWARLESMWHSKMKYCKSIENDWIVQEIDAIRSFDRSDQGDTDFPKEVRTEEFRNEERVMEAYQNLIRLMESPHDDNMNTLRALIYAKNNKRVLVAGSTRKRVKLDVLRRKILLLLISDLEVSEEELFGLKKIYQESHQNPTRTESQYEVVWMPVVDVRTTPWTEEKQQQFEALQGMMPWYFVYKPSVLAPQVIRYIKEVWRFNKKAVVVALDQQGKSVNNNALHMILIWRSLAFPFTRDREEALWREESWRIELVADTLHPAIPTWIEEKKHICLYGGGDIEWIRKFTLTAKAVAEDAGIPLEMLYVGKSGPRKILRNIALEKLGSYALQDLNHINYFWMRLESMWHSKVGLNSTIENDVIMQLL
ncbi:hypothetical protein Q3G72_026987 [Acer saccharum]|nr:hypothetical protein Q3G72_026987 [Acer saccharum]